MVNQADKIKVMVVDDSVIVRRIIGDIIGSDSRLELIERAPNGKIALDKLQYAKPDIVILDVEMPELNGLETLKALRQHDKETKVIMCSGSTLASSKYTVDALANGADDFIQKPEGGMGTDDIIATFKGKLLSRIHSVYKLSNQEYRPISSIKTRILTEKSRVDIIAIGISTGGPSALEKVIPKLPKNLKAPIVLVQHMPPVFTKSLADRLNSVSQLQVVEASEGQIVQAGCVYIAQGGKHLTVERKDLMTTILHLNEDPPENSCRPAVDVLFRSVAENFGKHVLAVVMTGMGYDGTKGGRKIIDTGGQLIIQDQASSVVWGMPGSIADAGLANGVYPLEQLASEIQMRVERKY